MNEFCPLIESGICLTEEKDCSLENARIKMEQAIKEMEDTIAEGGRELNEFKEMKKEVIELNGKNIVLLEALNRSAKRVEFALPFLRMAVKIILFFNACAFVILASAFLRKAPLKEAILRQIKAIAVFACLRLADKCIKIAFVKKFTELVKNKLN